jgi:hypothetical protein
MIPSDHVSFEMYSEWLLRCKTGKLSCKTHARNQFDRFHFPKGRHSGDKPQWHVNFSTQRGRLAHVLIVQKIVNHEDMVFSHQASISVSLSFIDWSLAFSSPNGWPMVSHLFCCYEIWELPSVKSERSVSLFRCDFLCNTEDIVPYFDTIAPFSTIIRNPALFLAFG